MFDIQIYSHLGVFFRWPFDEGAWKHVALKRSKDDVMGIRVAELQGLTMLTYAVQGGL